MLCGCGDEEECRGPVDLGAWRLGQVGAGCLRRPGAKGTGLTLDCHWGHPGQQGHPSCPGAEETWSNPTKTQLSWRGGALPCS